MTHSTRFESCFVRLARSLHSSFSCFPLVGSPNAVFPSFIYTCHILPILVDSINGMFQSACHHRRRQCSFFSFFFIFTGLIFAVVSRLFATLPSSPLLPNMVIRLSARSVLLLILMIVFLILYLIVEITGANSQLSIVAGIARQFHSFHSLFFPFHIFPHLICCTHQSVRCNATSPAVSVRSTDRDSFTRVGEICWVLASLSESAIG